MNQVTARIWRVGHLAGILRRIAHLLVQVGPMPDSARLTADALPSTRSPDLDETTLLLRMNAKHAVHT